MNAEEENDKRVWLGWQVNVKDTPTLHCKHAAIGLYKVKAGTYKDSLKSKQARCKYCHLRRKPENESGTSPPTCYWCSFHEVAVCRKYNCWQRHLSEVERQSRDEFGI